MPEKIDSLTLDIGLTSDEFQAGVNRILASMGRMESQAAETGEAMGASFASLGASVAGLAWRFAGMFLAFRSVEGLVDYFKNLSVELANLGFASKYLGQSGVELRRFGEVAEKSGGQAQDAITAVQGLNSAIFGLEYQGQMSQSLIALSRLGVGYTGPNGAPLPPKEVFFNLAKKLQEMYPGKDNTWLRVQWAQQAFPGAPGISNAIGGPLSDFEENYAKATKDNKDITQRLLDRQMELQKATTSLEYQIKDRAAVALDSVTDAIYKLIDEIENKLIPTLDELIGDLMDWLHPGKMLDKASEDPLGLLHPINDLAHFGAFLGGKFQEHMMKYRQDKLNAITIPATVTSRLASDTNLDALKLLHMRAGGEKGDPTWSKAITDYRALGGANQAARYVALATSRGDLSPEEGTGEMLYRLPASKPEIPPEWLSPNLLSTPSASRPQPPGPSNMQPPTSSIVGPRVQIDSIGPIYTQATDANGLMADINRAAQRKVLVANTDPGLA